MHYIPYMLKYWPKKFEEYNNSKNITKAQIHEAQMLLKEILDLKDQGYMNSYNKFVQNLDAVNVLSNFLNNNNIKTKHLIF